MAVILIHNGAVAGATQALFEGRSNVGSPGEDLNGIVDALATAVITANAALDTPMADGDNAQIGQVVQAVTCAVLKGAGNLTSTDETDYVGSANAIVTRSQLMVDLLD